MLSRDASSIGRGTAKSDLLDPIPVLGLLPHTQRAIAPSQTVSLSALVHVTQLLDNRRHFEKPFSVYLAQNLLDSPNSATRCTPSTHPLH